MRNRKNPFRFFWENENWSPWEDFNSMMNFGSGIAVDMYETEEDIIVEANLPGIEKKNVSLKILGKRLIIDARQEEETHEERENYLRQERRCGNIHRELVLPVEVDDDNSDAEMKDGVLTVVLPKKERKKIGGKEIKLK